jgi:hypothetical protein
VSTDEFEQAVRSIWTARADQSARQIAAGRTDTGTRGEATGGRHLDEFLDLLERTFIDCGVAPSAVRRGAGVELPGFFRPTKKWDLVVVERGRLIAAIELKSHFGPSFGNNFNNRVEEAIGSATDVRVAAEKGILGSLPPWLGYFLVLEEDSRSTQPVRLPMSPAFRPDPEFEHTSYADRYRMLCHRMLEEWLYDAVCMLAVPRDPATPVHEPDPDLSFDNFRRAIAHRVRTTR